MDLDTEPPRVAETAVRMSVALSGAIPVVGGVISGVSGALMILIDDVRARRSKRATDVILQIADGSGGDEELCARLGADEQLEATFVAAVEAAIKTSSEEKRKLIARVVVSAVNDPLKVDEAQLMVETLSQLDIPHVSALQRLSDESEHHKTSTEVSWGTSRVWAELPAPIQATLIRVGAAKTDPNALVATVGSMAEGITDYGLQILEALRAEASRPLDER